MRGKWSQMSTEADGLPELEGKITLSPAAEMTQDVNDTVAEEIARLFNAGVPEVEIIRQVNVRRYIVRNAIIFERGRQAGLAEAGRAGRGRQPGHGAEADGLPELDGKITISLAAEMLGVSRQTAHRMAKERQFDSWRVRSAGADRPVVVDLDQVLVLQAARQGKEIVVAVP